MEDPTNAQPIVIALLDGGLKQSEIVEKLKARGLRVTQPTISRIKSGARTNFELGMGLRDLHRSLRRSAARAVAS